MRPYSLSPTLKPSYRITQRSNHGQIIMSASEISFPSKQSPSIAHSMSRNAFLNSCWQSSIDTIFLNLALLKSSMRCEHCWLMRSRIFALRKVSLGIRLLPVENVSAMYQHTGSLSARYLPEWIKIGTFPSELGSLPTAFRYVCWKNTPFSPKLTCLNVAGSSFQIAVMSALCANGQNLLQIMVTSPLSCIQSDYNQAQAKRLMQQCMIVDAGHEEAINLISLAEQYFFLDEGSQYANI